jgi:copper ion binding protein
VNDTIDIAIQGMTCDHCVKSVTDALKRIAGVQAVQVSLAEKKARVIYDRARSNDQDLRAAIEAEGYNAQLYGTNTPNLADINRS